MLPIRSRTAIDVARNGALLAALWLGYTIVRSVSGDAGQVAIDNARRLLEFETRLGVAIGTDLQNLIDAPLAFVAANSYYLVHFPVTFIALVSAFVIDRHRIYVTLRNSLITVTGLALTIHLLIPLAPPRMLPEFVDTSSIYGPDPYALPGSEGANQFAAMPSLHVAWAILVACTLWQLNYLKGMRLFAVVHPILTTVVVLVTAHHFATDALVGAALAVIAITIHRNGDRARKQELVPAVVRVRSQR